MKLPKLTEVFGLREADPKMPDWAAKDEKDRASQLGKAFSKQPNHGQPIAKAPPETQKTPPKAAKPGMEQAKGKFLHVYQWAPAEASPNQVAQNKTKFDDLDQGLFASGQARVSDRGDPEHGWGVYQIAQDGSLKFVKDDWDSSG